MYHSPLGPMSGTWQALGRNTIKRKEGSCGEGMHRVACHDFSRGVLREQRDDSHMHRDFPSHSLPLGAAVWWSADDPEDVVERSPKRMAVSSIDFPNTADAPTAR